MDGEHVAQSDAGHQSDDADDGGHAQRSIAAIDQEAEHDRQHDEQHGDHGGTAVGQIVGFGALGAGGESADHDGAESGNHQQQGQIGEHQEQLLAPAADVDLDDVADGLALMTDGGEQSGEVVGGADEDAADQDPQQNGDPAEDSGLNGAVDGAGACDGGEVVAQQDGRLSGDVVIAVGHGVSGGLSGRIDAPLLSQPSAVEQIAADQHDDADQQDNE